VRIQLDSRTVLAIPARAIRQEGGRPVVHVIDGQATEIRPVRIGWRDGPWAEIAEGLSQGERILLNATVTAGEEAK
jgi:multidrug efflux pump subunit AcrA (membrane-fusion protein)